MSVNERNTNRQRYEKTCFWCSGTFTGIAQAKFCCNACRQANKRAKPLGVSERIELIAQAVDYIGGALFDAQCPSNEQSIPDAEDAIEIMLEGKRISEADWSLLLTEVENGVCSSY